MQGFDVHQGFADRPVVVLGLVYFLAFAVNTADVGALSFHQDQALDGRWQGLAQVLGMDCGACSLELEAEAQRVQGLDALQVNPATGMLSWVASEALAIDVFDRRVRALGYRLCPTASGESASDQRLGRVQKQQRVLFLRALIALLCMMQIMMYSAPEYLYSPQNIGVQALHVLRWAQWVLALPLLLYCAQPFWVRALRATMQGRWVMDQPVALGLALAFGVSSAQMHNPLAPVWFDSIAMLLALLLLTQWLTQQRSMQALQCLAQAPLDLPTHVPVRIQVGSDVQWQDTRVLQLRPGDCFALPANTACPVDAVVVAQAAPLWVDEAMRTGEASPVCKQAGQWVWAGSRVLSQGALLQTVQSAQHSSFAQLGQALQRALACKPCHPSLVDKILPGFVLAVLCCAAVSALLWWWLVSGGQAAAVAVAVLIVTCPCASALALPLVRLVAMQALKRVGILVRNPAALDVLAKAHCFAFDKTGTLAPRHAATVVCQVLQESALCPAALLQHVATHIAQGSAHPLAQAVHGQGLRLAALKAGPHHDPAQWPLQAVQEHSGLGLQAVWAVQGQAVRVRLGAPAWCGVQAVAQTASLVCLEVCCAQQPEVVWGRLCFQVDWPAMGAQAEQALNTIRRCGAVYLLSGDTLAAVHAWQPHLVFDGRCGAMQAEDKTQWVQAQQQQGAVVVMVGDGLNDSTAFATADVAVAAQGASALAASQADFLIQSPQAVLALEKAIWIVRKARVLGQQNLAWALAYNLVAVPLAASGLLNPWMAALGMGLSSAVVLGNALRLGLD